MHGLAQLVLECSRVQCDAYEGALFRYVAHHMRSLPSTLERPAILYLGNEGLYINAIHRCALEGAYGVRIVRDLRNVLCYQHSIVDQQQPHAEYTISRKYTLSSEAAR
jgi:hypothetical protein